MKTVTLPVKGLNFAGCAPEIEKNLGKQEFDREGRSQPGDQTVTYDETRLSQEQLRAGVQGCGFACGGTHVGTTMASQDGSSNTQQAQQMQHGDGTAAPATMPGTPTLPEAAGAPKASDVSSDMQMDQVLI